MDLIEQQIYVIHFNEHLIIKPSLTIIQSTLRIQFTGIRCREFEVRHHRVSLTLPPVLHGASDAALVQYVLFALTGGKMYSAVNNLSIDEEAIELDTLSAEKNK